MDEQQKIQELLKKLEMLLHKQDKFQVEVNQIKREIYRLSSQHQAKSDLSKFSQDALEGESELMKEPIGEEAKPLNLEKEQQLTKERVQAEMAELKQKEEVAKTKTKKVLKPAKAEKSWLSTYIDNLAFEQFIGENLINKIGILITVIGVGIGARYAIENDWISPLTRIIFGYLVGLGLLGTAFRIKNQYEAFSAVLLSGAMAILYFITFAGFSFYSLIPQGAAFILMAIFTIFTVLAALHYDRMIIAILGLVGAYGVPFLLSTGSGNVLVLYSYMTIINIGVLIIAVQKYWKLLYNCAFAITWLIFASWLFIDFEVENHFAIAFFFSLIFFIIFYATFLGYKVWKEQELNMDDIILLLANSFFFFGFGYLTLLDHETYKNFLGLFTVFNALLHFIVSVGIFYRNLANKRLFYFVAGLVLVFLTMAIPIQLDGQWVTLIWSMEAVLLFWLGRKYQVGPYEQWSYVLMVLAFGSLLHDWGMYYDQFAFSAEGIEHSPIFNVVFLGSLLFLMALGAILVIKERFPGTAAPKGWLKEPINLISSSIPILFIGVLYFAFYLEIMAYFDVQYARSNPFAIGGGSPLYDADIKSFKQIWLILYSMGFFTIMAFVYQKWFKEWNWGIAIDALLLMALGAYLTIGLFELSELRDSYLLRDSNEYFNPGIFQVMLRYLSYLFCGVLLAALFQRFRTRQLVLFELILATTVLWLLSAELINIRAFLTEYPNYKVGLSILWGVYALVLVGIGIGKKKKHLRIAAMALFGLTLAKLFLYDITQLNTIAKTVVMVSLGILLLIFSFLYNKFQIDDETDAP